MTLFCDYCNRVCDDRCELCNRDKWRMRIMKKIKQTILEYAYAPVMILALALLYFISCLF